MDKPLPDFSRVPPWVFDLPPVNASLNALCTILLIVGWCFIRRKQVAKHAVCMISALVVSIAFLTCYLLYHFSLHRYAGNNASVPFTHPGPIKVVYLTILISHIFLAVVNLPMVICTVVPAIRRRFDKHRRLARWTLPIWLYVSVTGVIVYVMVYHLYPSAVLPR